MSNLLGQDFYIRKRWMLYIFVIKLWKDIYCNHSKLWKLRQSTVFASYRTWHFKDGQLIWHISSALWLYPLLTETLTYAHSVCTVEFKKMIPDEMQECSKISTVIIFELCIQLSHATSWISWAFRSTTDIFFFFYDYPHLWLYLEI